MKCKKIAIFAGLMAGLFTGFGYAAEVSSAVCFGFGQVPIQMSVFPPLVALFHSSALP